MSAALLIHLWQSTAFAVGAWFLAWALRHNGARLRHAVWFAASIKFLVPFSWLAMAGHWMRPYVAIDNSPVLAALGLTQVSGLSGEDALGAAGASEIAWRIAAVIWLIGSLLLGARWVVRSRRVRRLVRDAIPVAIAAPLPARTSPQILEPGVVGILRPVLLLPAQITTRLTASQLEAILRHELCHVRRQDNLTSAVHMLVETVFWFHPLVWWIGARLLEERERACDEAVVRAGSDPRTYAEGILRVCQSGLAPDLACVAGVSGADLKLRLEAIMTREVKELGFVKRFALGALALTAISLPVMTGMAAPAQGQGVQQAAKSIGKIELLSGKRVKLQYQDVDVRGLIAAMGEAAGVNILVSDKVSGTVTVKLAEMPWAQALDIILSSQGLVKREKDGILFVEPASA